MHKAIKILSILSLTLSSLFSYAGTPRFDHYDISNGLSGNRILAMEIDNSGYIWLGSDNGLNKFDGYNFSLFEPGTNISGTLVGNGFTALKEDNNGNIWAVTHNGGLNKFDYNRKVFTHFEDSLFNSFSGETANHLVISGDSLVWFGSNLGIVVYNIKNGKSHSVSNFRFLKSIVENNNGILVGGEFGLYSVIYNSDSVLYKKILNIPIYDIQSYNNKNIIVTENEILQFNDSFAKADTLVLFNNATNSFDPRNITSMAINHKQIWISSNKSVSLFEKCNGESGKYCYQSTSYIQHGATLLKFDKADNLWIASDLLGVFVYSKRKNQFSFLDSESNTFPLKSYHKDNPVNSVCKGLDNTLWIGSVKGNITAIKADGTTKKYEYYFDKNGKRRNMDEPRGLHCDSKGNIWLSNYSIVGIYNPDKDRFESLWSKYGIDWTRLSFCIKELTPGIVTITGDEYIAEIDINENSFIKQYPTSHNGVYLWKAIRDIATDKYNNLWVVQNTYGLVKISRPELHYTRILKNDAGFTDNKIYDIEIQGDSMWLATNIGLNLYDISTGKVIKKYLTASGLSNNKVFSVITDNKNNLWLSTGNGINYIDIRTDNITTYLPNDFFYEGAFHKDLNGNIYFGGYNGLVLFNPSYIEKITIDPKPIVEDFFINNKPVNVNDTIEKRVLLTERLKHGSKIILNYKQNSFSFLINATPFETPHYTNYRYKLSGLQSNWIYISKDNRMVNYTSVLPGNYTFTFQVQKGDNSWSDGTSVFINIEPPFWQTIWFKIALLLFIAIVIYSFVQYRITRFKNAGIVLERKVAEQTKELKEQNKQITEISEKLHEADQEKIQFFTNISHEFRTPLTMILGYIENLDKSKSEHSKTIITRNANRLLELVNQLIEVRKLDKGQLKLQVSEFDIASFTKDIVQSFQMLAEKKNISLEFISDTEALNVFLDADKTEKILSNLISNAIKYTSNDESVIVSIATYEHNFEILVEDSGVGIAKENIDKVFDRFYRIDSNVSEGHGIGLSLVKGWTEIQHGTIAVESDINKGSIFKLTFKKGNNHFKNDEFVDNYKKTEKPIEINTYNELKKIKNNYGYKILIVEDNTELTNYLIDILNNDFVLETATNGAIALEKLEHYSPDLIISDIMMPQMDGITFCNKVKSDTAYSHIPFIMLTAKTGVETKIQGFSIGIDDFITKPFNPKELIARITATLLNREQFKKHILSFNATEEIKSEWLNENDKKFWNKINDIINTNYSDSDFNAEKLSTLLYMSRATFYRKFKDLTGLNAAEHIRKTRLHKANELILSGETNIENISAMVGFKSVSQFRKNFKEEFGITPSQVYKK